MKTAEKTDVKEYYKSGFPKQVTRNKYNLMINDRLRAARNRKKLSSAKVCEELKAKGISVGHSTLRGYEADEKSKNHRYPSLITLVELTNFYEVSLDYIFGRSDKFEVTPPFDDSFDLLDLMDSDSAILFDGKKLNRKQVKFLKEALDSLSG